jgi:uncharacterized membrane protein YdjX (TVP38/TMEM64 family)
MQWVAAAIVVLATVGLFAIWRAQARDPARWQQRLREGPWLRALAWTAVLTAAAVAGSLLGGAPGLAEVALTLGGAALFGLFIFWSCARTFGGPPDQP